MGEHLNQIKAIIVGEGFSGKTALTVRMIHDSFQEKYDTTILVEHDRNVCYENQQYRLTIYDTAGQEDYQTIRTQHYEYAGTQIR